jgi:hypothetical protein
VLVIKGIGPVPAKKNSKLLFRDKRTGKPQLRTKPEYQEWTKKCVQLIVSQLCSGTPTSEDGTWTGPCPPSRMRFAPLDDNWREIEYGEIRAEKVEKGEEGAVITIELNSPPHW